MEKKSSTTQLFPQLLLGGSLALLLAGCMAQNGHLKPESTSTPSAPAAGKVAAPGSAPKFIVSEPATTAVLNIEQPHELAVGGNTLPDEEMPPEEEADDDPAAEDEGVIGEAVNDAAQELFDKIAAAEEAQHSDSIWPRIRAGFTLPDRDHPRVQPDREWFMTHQAYLDRTFTRAVPYLHYIMEEVQARGMPMEIALLPVVESAYQPFAYSRSRAAGIWQFIPGTANLYGLKIDWWYDGRRDIHASTNAALTYLQKLHDQFNGDWLLALAAYNSGEGTVARAIAKNQNRGLGTTYWDLDLPRETESYVPRLLAIADIVDNPERFGLTIKEIPNKPVMAAVDIGDSQMDLAIAADIAGLTLDELYTLNPAFNSWATAPNRPHKLLLPLERVEEFQSKLAALPPEQRLKWLRHQIGKGENLKQIAQKYKTTVATLQRTNNLSGNRLQAGKTLLIAVASRPTNEYILSAEQRYENKQSTLAARGAKSIYTVRAGETLWRISNKHKVSVSSLMAWNNMSADDALRAGQKLVIWKGEKSKTRISRAEGQTQRIKYRVRSGDSLARISEKFNVTVKELKQWNPKARNRNLQPGQKLVLYVDVIRMAKG